MARWGPENMGESKGAWPPQETPLYFTDVETETQINPREAPIFTPALNDALRGASTIHLALEKVQGGTDNPRPMVRAGTRVGALGGKMPKLDL